MELQAGKRWRLKNEDEYLLVQQGVVEVYAVTASQESYRQEYLFPLKAGQAVFPAFDFKISEVKKLNTSLTF